MTQSFDFTVQIKVVSFNVQSTLDGDANGAEARASGGSRNGQV